jgi:hypothetical protein
MLKAAHKAASLSAFGSPQFEVFASDKALNPIILSNPQPNGRLAFDVTTAIAAIPEPSTWRR